MTRTLTAIVSAVILLVLALSTQAQIIPSTVVTYDGNITSSDVLSITYEVTESGGLYTYSYILSTSPAIGLSTFTIGGTGGAINTQGVANVSGGNGYVVSIGSIEYEWAFNPGSTSDTVSYTSPFGPTYATFSLNGSSDDWGSDPLIPAPAPVPEASTLLAGALMIVPFGVGIFRSLRKDRGF